MDLIRLVGALCLIGFLIYLLTEHVPMTPGWKKALQIGALVVLVLYLISRLVNIPNVLP